MGVEGLTISVATSRVHDGAPCEVEILEDLGPVLLVGCLDRHCTETAELELAEILPYL